MSTFLRLKSQLKHDQKYDEDEAVFFLENVSYRRFTIFVFRILRKMFPKLFMVNNKQSGKILGFF